MYRILFALVELAAAGVFLLPLFLLYGKFTAHSRMQIFCSILFGFFSPQFWHWSAFRASSTTARMSRCISSPLQASLPISKMPV